MRAPRPKGEGQDGPRKISGLAARGKSPTAFDRRCIPAACVGGMLLRLWLIGGLLPIGSCSFDPQGRRPCRPVLACRNSASARATHDQLGPLLAPCQPGASPVSVRRGTFTTDCYAMTGGMTSGQSISAA